MFIRSVKFNSPAGIGKLTSGLGETSGSGE